MKDNVSQGISNARQKNTLANDAQVATRNKQGVVKRDNAGRGNGLLNTTSPSSAQKILSRNGSTNNGQNDQARQRLQKRQKNINRALKTAEKIPVVNKYAKAAKTAMDMKSKFGKSKMGLLSSFLGAKQNNQSSNQDLEDAKAAEQRGEEYNPEQSEMRVTAISNKTLLLVGAFIMLGMMTSLIFIAILLTSAITGAASESYLETKENPTYDELGEKYEADEKNEEENDSDDNQPDSNSEESDSNDD